MEDVKKLLKKSKALFNSDERNNQMPVLNEIAEFVLPGFATGFIDTDTTPGLKKMRRVLSPFAIQANQDLAAAMHSMLTNPSTKWPRVTFAELSSDPTDEELEWMEVCNAITYNKLYENNFDAQLSKNYQSYTAFGNMCLLGEPMYKEGGIFDRFRFEAVHMAEVAFAENIDGIVETVCRKYQLTVDQMFERWPDKIPSDLLAKRDREPDKKYDIYHIVEKRDPKQVKLDKFGLAQVNQRPYKGYYILEKGNVELEEVGHYEFPYYVPRWQTIPGHVWGFGPGHVAIGGVRSYNKVVELNYKRLALNVMPPTVTEEDNTVSSVDYRPGHEIVVRSIDKFKQLPPAGNAAEIQGNIEELKNEIRSCFYLDKLFLPDRREIGEMSAFETDQRLVQTQRVLGPTMAKLHSEFLSPLVTNTFKCLLREGQFPPPPDSLMVEGRVANIEVKFVNQLTRAQNVEEITNLQAYMQDLILLAQVNPSVRDLINTDEAGLYLARKRNVPETIINNKEDIKAGRDKQAAAMAEQANLDAGLKEADILSKIPQ